MHALVTGGGGFLGRYIVEQLLLRGDDVRVFCRGRYDDLTQSGVEVIQGDLQDPAAVTRACHGIDAVFHVAAVPGIWGPWSYYHGINTAGTQYVVDACRANRVERLIYTSSPSVVFDGTDHIDADESLPYPERWLCHYPHSKALAEQAVLAANDSRTLRTVSLRPHLIWGPRDNHLIPRLMERARSGRLRRVGNGRNVVSVAYVENAAAAHLQAEESLRRSDSAAGRAYFINEPDAVNLWDWVNQLLSLAGIDPVTKSVSAEAAYRLGAVIELAWTALRVKREPPMTRFVAQQLAGSHSYSIAAARRDFGYDPPVTFEQAMDRLAASGLAANDDSARGRD
ncbi:MAG: NAD-dependent epimerase/dehydratase family protein [Planctomycetaceae bacterium]